MKIQITLNIDCNFDMYYELKYEGVAHVVKGDAGLVTYLKRRFGLEVEDGFQVASRFLEVDETILDMCFSKYC